MIRGYEIQMYCDKHKESYWLDSAVPLRDRGCPVCLGKKPIKGRELQLGDIILPSENIQGLGGGHIEFNAKGKVVKKIGRFWVNKWVSKEN